MESARAREPQGQGGVQHAVVFQECLRVIELQVLKIALRRNPHPAAKGALKVAWAEPEGPGEFFKVRNRAGLRRIKKGHGFPYEGKG